MTKVPKTTLEVMFVGILLIPVAWKNGIPKARPQP